MQWLLKITNNYSVLQTHKPQGGANDSVGGCIYGDTDKCKALVQLGVAEKCNLDKMQGLLKITNNYSVLQNHKPQGSANDSVGGCIHGETDKYKTCAQLGMIGKVWFGQN